MTNFTRDAIKKAFIELLNERPYHKITVKDVVTRCGINRNSFYYHYQDLPALAEEIGKEAGEKIISRFYSIDSMEECLNEAALFLLANRKTILNLYRSEDREMLERNIWQVCDCLVDKYRENAFGCVRLSEEDLRIISAHVRSLCFGQMMNWLEQGMPESIKYDIPRICELSRLVLSGFLEGLNETKTRK